MVSFQTGVDVNAINIEVMMLFKKCQESPEAIIPMLYDKLACQPAILFIGLNPSFDECGIRKVWNKHSGKAPTSLIDVIRMYTLKNDRSEKDLEQIIRTQRLAKEHYGKYFNPLKIFAEQENRLTLWDPEEEPKGATQFWEHIDLFFERETKPDKLEAIDGHTLRDFGTAQLRLTEKLIHAICPQNIIVVNRTASEILSKFSTFSWSDDPKMKCKEVNLDQRLNCKVFLSQSWSWGVGKKLGHIQNEIQQTLNQYKPI
jgi:hypothetical protein